MHITLTSGLSTGNICKTDSPQQLRRLVIPLEPSNDPSMPTPSVAAWPPTISIVDVLLEVLFLQTVTMSAISNGEESSSQMKVGSVLRRRMAEYGYADACVMAESHGMGIGIDHKAGPVRYISITSFDFTLCSILAVTSITCSSRTMPAPSLPEPAGTFSSSTTSESCHGLPSVRICIQQGTCGTQSLENSISATKADNCSRSECSFSNDLY